MGAKIKDLTSMKFVRLTVIRIHNLNGRNTTWECKCECGNTKIVSGISLRNGHTKSCGCLLKESNTTHGMKNTRLYNIWRSMKSRCLVKNNVSYRDYGGRGIVICEEWLNNFLNFYNWAVSNGYTEELSIDRVDFNGNYEPNNCRWADNFTQAQNQRIRKDNKTGHKGICYRKDTNKYSVNFQLNGEKHRLGSFNTIEEAIKAKNNYLKEVKRKCKK